MQTFLVVSSAVTMMGVFVALLSVAWPRLQVVATRRLVFYLMRKSWRHMLFYPTSRAKRSMRMRLWYERGTHSLTAKLVPLHYRLSLISLSEEVEKELRANCLSDTYFPHPESNPLYVEIAGYIHYKDKKDRDKSNMKRHKGVVCAGGCGTKYGKKRKDHSFSGGGGVRDSGGWRCEWINTATGEGSCFPKSTGDHYCGMCQMEREGWFGEKQENSPPNEESSQQRVGQTAELA